MELLIRLADWPSIVRVNLLIFHLFEQHLTPFLESCLGYLFAREQPNQARGIILPTP